MAWTEVDAAPSFGTLRTPGGIDLIGPSIRDRMLEMAAVGIPAQRPLFDWYSCQDGILGVPIDPAEPSGELSFTGGGGSTRPSGGFLYPRGDN